MAPILENPANAFHATTWAIIEKHVPKLRDMRICVPSSGDNYAAYAFAMLGAKVISCDIAENQLANAARIAQQYDWGQNIEFICQDTLNLKQQTHACNYVGLLCKTFAKQRRGSLRASCP